MKHWKKERPKGKKGRLSAWFHSSGAKCALVCTLASLLLLVLFCISCAPQRYDLRVGSISHQTITATKEIVDEAATEAKRRAAADAVELPYIPLEGASDQVMADLKSVFDELRIVQQYGLTLRTEEDTAETIRYRTFSDEEIAYAQTLVTLLTLSRYQYTTLLRTSSEDFDVMVSSVTTAVENVLNASVREGQVNQAIEIIKTIVGYRVDLSLMQNIVPTVLRNCVKANMVVNQEVADAARQKARDAVEPVVYQQGQVIIRDGEVVNANQLAVLQSLGLTQNGQFDYFIYIGAVISVCAAMLVLLLLQWMLDETLLCDLRKTLVVMCAIVFSVSLCMVTGKLLNVYFMPTIMAGMLLTGLLGWRAGVPAVAGMTVFVSGLTAAGGNTTVIEMVLVPLCALVSGVTSVRFLQGKPQRVRVIFCGIVCALVNAAVLVGFALMTSFDLSRMGQNIPWFMGGAILSGAVVLGLQPVFESAFNLATPSKLMELGSPNQPLLRRLLIEAPGTYHHSIIVANLAEAAAEKIEANPLLARTGAYFHDIGKLKRPLYFKENQMGENPHDTTDPYVSAAIVTTHTRDGLLLAQQFHLPPEIQQIIVQHHGDTPVMYFYHKAKQMAGDKPVDIKDFRYDGQRPNTREAAIIMLADTVEAAVRSMPDPTPESIAQFIEKLVRGKLEDGQLSDAPLTLRDIDGICEAFGTVLNGVFHERIEYPNAEVPQRTLFSLHHHDKEAKKVTEKAAEQPHPAVPGKTKPEEEKPAKADLPQKEADDVQQAEEKPEAPAAVQAAPEESAEKPKEDENDPAMDH